MIQLPDGRKIERGERSYGVVYLYEMRQKGALGV